MRSAPENRLVGYRRFSSKMTTSASLSAAATPLFTSSGSAPKNLMTPGLAYLRMLWPMRYCPMEELSMQ